MTDHFEDFEAIDVQTGVGRWSSRRGLRRGAFFPEETPQRTAEELGRFFALR